VTGAEMTAEAAQALREPFPASAIGKLPKAGAQLDYVGHAAVTDRLLAVDPCWTWEPMAYAPDGGPLIRVGGKDAELWIWLTVCGHRRPGVGTAPAGSFELAKQLVSDAIRNAAMRAGVGLDLWAKEDLHDIANPPAPVKPISPERAQRFTDALNAGTAEDRKAWLERFRVKPADLPLDLLPDAQAFVDRIGGES
jgi:hypothetical protein